MLNIYIQFGIYGLVIVFILSLIKIWIFKESLTDIQPSTLIFGFLIGSIGKSIFDKMMEELYIDFPTITIICLSSLGLGILGTTIQIVFRRNEI